MQYHKLERAWRKTFFALPTCEYLSVERITAPLNEIRLPQRLGNRQIKTVIQPKWRLAKQLNSAWDPHQRNTWFQSQSTALSPSFTQLQLYGRGGMLHSCLLLLPLLLCILMRAGGRETEPAELHRIGHVHSQNGQKGEGKATEIKTGHAPTQTYAHATTVALYVVPRKRR